MRAAGDSAAKAGEPAEEGLPQRTRLAVACFALLAGTLGFRYEFDAAWWLAVLLGINMAAFYALPAERTWGRVGMAISVATFGGLGGWALVGLGAWSLLAAAIGSASFLVYCALADRRSASQTARSPGSG